PSMRLASSNSVRPTFCPPSAFSITIALNVATRSSRSWNRTYRSTEDRDRRQQYSAVALSPISLSGGCSGPRHRLLDNRQVDESGHHAEQDGAPPDDVIRAGSLVQQPAQIDSERPAHLMAEERNPDQHRQPARAEHHADEARRRRHRGQP